MELLVQGTDDALTFTPVSSDVTLTGAIVDFVGAGGLIVDNSFAGCYTVQ